MISSKNLSLKPFSIFSEVEKEIMAHDLTPVVSAPYSYLLIQVGKYLKGLIFPVLTSSCCIVLEYTMSEFCGM